MPHHCPTSILTCLFSMFVSLKILGSCKMRTPTFEFLGLTYGCDWAKVSLSRNLPKDTASQTALLSLPIKSGLKEGIRSLCIIEPCCQCQTLSIAPLFRGLNTRGCLPLAYQ
jgi:hypothetical protein